MEINVTSIMTDHCLSDYSDSVFRSGRQDIGRVTWRNACEAIEALDKPLVRTEGQDDLRQWVLEFGAWTQEEIDALSDVETQALLLQFIASDGQEYLDAVEGGYFEQWDEDFGGRLYQGDDGSWYFYVGM